MTFITAEIGINHNGSIEIAKKLIDVASSAGCDAVKFQKRNVEKVYLKKVLDTYRESMWGTTTREQKLGLEFSEKQYTSLIFLHILCWFGFDGFIIPKGYTKTFGELSNKIKNNISHRALAFKKLLNFLT